ncbi:predicted protein [Aspergillus terreus NIH2624]|uniref:Uncharacterized protein n=1 Tax=Aspergillus terreus (strain NIH 2624 / FGSC A1156) TaxID=341663 RepID=Q0CF86_ASPTN|nr:uncharacterized protein ATEG_07648 [Aspergillus terreus NIH2624]EAU31910.1 predicted protein [Aspergillus terreus NIH2624]
MRPHWRGQSESISNVTRVEPHMDPGDRSLGRREIDDDECPISSHLKFGPSPSQGGKMTIDDMRWELGGAEGVQPRAWVVCHGGSLSCIRRTQCFKGKKRSREREGDETKVGMVAGNEFRRMKTKRRRG